MPTQSQTYSQSQSHPTLEWSSLQDVFYRKSQIYSLSWGIQSDFLNHYSLATADSGGFIALLRTNNSNFTKVNLITNLSRLKPQLQIYTQAGQLVESIPLDPSNRIVGLGFTSSEKLVLVLEEGLVRIYTLLSPCPISPSTSTSTQSTSLDPDSNNSNPSSSSKAFYPIPVEATANSYYISYSLGQEATETGVIDSKIWNGGLVALTSNGRFIDWRFPNDDQSLSGSGGVSDGNWSPDESSSSFPQPKLLPLADFNNPSSSNPGNLASSSIQPPSSWNIVSPQASSSGLLEIFISPSSTPVQNPTTNQNLDINPSNASSSTSTSSSAANEGGGTICTLDSLSGLTDMRLSRGPFYSIKPSPNGKLLALLTFDRKLWVVSSDFQRSLSEFDVNDSSIFQSHQQEPNLESSLSKNNLLPGFEDRGGLGGTGIRQIEWCGNNTVALAWINEVLMVGPFGDSLRYQYQSPVHLVPELDGLRIISSDKHEFITKVPSSSTSVFLPGSTHPSAILFEASQHFAMKNPKADDGIRAIRSSSSSSSKNDDLIIAVDTCCTAAAFEFDVSWQKKLLKAANFGKSFLENYDVKGFVEMGRTLRVLNACRNYEIGIPISYEQYISTSPTPLISRLSSRNHHLLALKISEFLSIRPDPILKHWARAKIARFRPLKTSSLELNGTSSSNVEAEDQICRAIVEKFEKQPAASYSEIARVAWKAGRIRLATKLLDHEPRAVDQVPLLLNMHEDKIALVKAIESGDTDLIYHVILRLKSQLSRGDFFRIVQSPVVDFNASNASSSANPSQSKEAQTSIPSHLSLAANLLEVYALEQDRELLKDFYYQDDRRTETALLTLDEAKMEEDGQEKVFKLKEAMKLFGEDRERALESKMTDEQIRLIGFQTALDREEVAAGRVAQFEGLSLNATLKKCLSMEQTASSYKTKVEKLRNEFKIPDKRFWTLKMITLIENKEFETLWSFANSKKSPIGFEPFVSKLIRGNHVEEAMRYVPLAGKDRNDRAKLSSLCQRIPQQNVANDIVNFLEGL